MSGRHSSTEEHRSATPTVQVRDLLAAYVWRDGRAVEGNGLENRNGRKSIGGSNPSLCLAVSGSRCLMGQNSGLSIRGSEFETRREHSGEMTEWLKVAAC